MSHKTVQIQLRKANQVCKDTGSMYINYDHVDKCPKEMKEDLNNYVQKNTVSFLLQVTLLLQKNVLVKEDRKPTIFINYKVSHNV